MKFKTAMLELTPEQTKKLAPLFNYASKRFQNYAIIGQFFGYSDGTIEFEAAALPVEVCEKIMEIVASWKLGK